jgi:DNA primase catalytic core
VNVAPPASSDRSAIAPGLSASTPGGCPAELHSRLLAANRAAAAFYAAQLPRVERAVNYLRDRGIEAAAGSWWQPGYAPGAWTALLDHLQDRGFTADDLIEAGLARLSRTGRLLDYMRDRVVFPIHDLYGEVIGFTGRDMSRRPGTPKYLNTPTTPVYQKSTALFGLGPQLARRDPRDHRPVRAVLVEGAADAIAVHRMAHDHGEHLISAALCGVMLTEGHVQLLAAALPPGTPLTLVLDGDNAGRQAFERWLPHLRQWQSTVEVATLPDGVDPADLLAAHGPAAALGVILDCVQPSAVAHLSRILDRLLTPVHNRVGAPARPLDLAEPESRVAVWRAITPCFRDAPSLAPDLAELAADRLGLPLAEVMTGVVNQIGLPPDQPTSRSRARRARPAPKPKRARPTQRLRAVPLSGTNQTLWPAQQSRSTQYARALEAFRSAQWRRAA